jgi:uncharacterized membrane protein
MYFWLKLLHVASVTIFLGNIITGLFWHAHAARTRDQRLIAHAMDGIIRSDRLFTLPGVFLIIVTGVATAMVGGVPILGTSWVVWSLGLFALSGVAFMARVAPLQRELLAFARRDPAAFDFGAYQSLARKWEFWGAIALATPLGALALMVLKPVF